MDNVAVLIPCYNEELTIRKVIEDSRVALPDAKIYVYDNNSSDRTATIAEDAGAIVRQEHLQGKGNVVRRMFREIDALVYLMVDGDDTYPMDAAPEMVEKVLYHNADMVVGDRLSSTYFKENKRRFHSFGNSLVRTGINKLFDSDIKDIMTGMRAFSYDFAKTFSVLSKGFEIETEMTIHAVHNNMQIENVVIDYRDRAEGSESKLDTFRDGAKVIKTLIGLFRNYKPLHFFGILSLILAILAGLFFAPVLKEYIKTGVVERFPTLIVCGFAVLAALLSLFAGMILSNQEKNERRSFEMFRNIVSLKREKE